LPFEILSEFWIFLAIGFAAQLVDGALGMAYGIISTTVLVSIGIPPAQASAITHSAEVFTTGASAIAHIRSGNVDWSLVARLTPAGIAGAVAGAVLVSQFNPELVRPFVAGWLLLMGFVLLFTALRKPRDRPPKVKGAIPLGLAGGFLDASGGGGWGPVVTSTLLGSGHAPRTTIGSVNTSEFAVTCAAAGAFAALIGIGHLEAVAGLIIGGVLAAPLAAHVVKLLPARILMAFVGLLVIALSAWQLRLLGIAALEFLTPDALRNLAKPTSL
jgi:uncharacterized membrane protein YfcA